MQRLNIRFWFPSFFYYKFTIFRINKVSYYETKSSNSSWCYLPQISPCSLSSRPFSRIYTRIDTELILSIPLNNTDTNAWFWNKDKLGLMAEGILDGVRRGYLWVFLLSFFVIHPFLYCSIFLIYWGGRWVTTKNIGEAATCFS